MHPMPAKSQRIREAIKDNDVYAGAFAGQLKDWEA